MAERSEREKVADNIIAAPHLYKVCVGCDSIVNLKIVVCVYCHAYRFDESAELVVQQAKRLRDQPPSIKDTVRKRY